MAGKVCHRLAWSVGSLQARLLGPCRVGSRQVCLVVTRHDLSRLVPTCHGRPVPLCFVASSRGKTRQACLSKARRVPSGHGRSVASRQARQDGLGHFMVCRGESRQAWIVIARPVVLRQVASWQACLVTSGRVWSGFVMKRRGRLGESGLVPLCQGRQVAISRVKLTGVMSGRGSHMNEIGHNQPDMTETAGEVTKDLSGWLSENPVIENEDQARAAKLLIDRGSLCIGDLEDERKGKTAPLNERIEAINGHYRAPRELLKGIIDECKRRFDSFLLLEERKRNVAAAEAARLAECAEQRAREAERKEREAFEEADSGVIGLDIAAVTADADKAFSDYQKAQRQAVIAEKETKVKIAGGFRRASSLKNKEDIVVNGLLEAIADICESNVPIDGILDSVVKASRLYRKIYQRLPHGVESRMERKS